MNSCDNGCVFQDPKTYGVKIKVSLFLVSFVVLQFGKKSSVLGSPKASEFNLCLIEYFL